VFAGIGLNDGLDERDEVIRALEERGYPVLDLTDDEMSKVHVRHMVGGRGHNVGDEVLYHVRFPERPGALLNFLKRLGKRWNISLFHYRNHGADYGACWWAFRCRRRSATSSKKAWTSWAIRTATNPTIRPMHCF